MNEKLLKIIIYTSIFSVAYGGFFYHRYTLNNAVAENHVTASSSLLTFKNTNTDKNRTINSTEHNNVPEMSAISRKKHIDKKNTVLPHSSFSSPATYPDTQASTYNEQVRYFKEEKKDQTAKTFMTTTGLNHAAADSGFYHSSSSQNLLTASRNTSKIFSDQNAGESDGYEFLPDGSSQQDLFNANAKNPRVYTIKDYQTADISCAPGYDDASSPHAQLIRGLKGC